MNMRDRRISEREAYLLDDDDDDEDVSSNSSEPGDCNWMVLAGIFLIQLVVSGVLASYGVLLARQVEDNDTTIRESLWTPIIYIATWCLSDPVCKILSDRRHGQSCRLLALVGIIMAASGVAASTLLKSSGLQTVGYGLLGGLGTSLVLTQVDIILYCHYPPYSRSAAFSHCVPQLGSALAHFAMPLLLLGFVSSYGPHGAPLLQAGLILQGILGALTFVPPKQRHHSTSRYNPRPRAFTFIGNDVQSIVERDNYINSSCTDGNQITPHSNLVSRNSNNSTSNNEVLESTNKNLRSIYEISSRCNKNPFGIDILPEIPEESEYESETNCDDSIEDLHETENVIGVKNSEVGSSDISLNKVESMAVIHDINKRWSIGTIQDVLPEHGGSSLLQEHSISKLADTNIETEKKHKLFINKSLSDFGQISKEWERSTCPSSQKQMHVDHSDVFSGNGILLTAKSLDELISVNQKKDLREFDPILSNSADITNVHNLVNRKSASEVVPVFGNIEFNKQGGSSKSKVINDESDCSNDSFIKEITVNDAFLENKLLLGKDKVCKRVKDQSHINNSSQRWSLGSIKEISSLNDKLNSENLDSRKWHSAELSVDCDASDTSDMNAQLSPKKWFPLEIIKDSNENLNVDEPECLSSSDTENPLWAAALSSETVAINSNSSSIRGSSSLRQWRRNSTIQRLRYMCVCHCCHRRKFRWTYPDNRSVSQIWKVLEYLATPYLFPSLLLKFSLRFCPMGFAALTPILAKRLISGCTMEEAVFSVSVSGFVWLCFLLVMPWCAKMTLNKRKYLFAVGNFIAAIGLHFLSMANSHDKITLSCAIFGLGLGATMITGNTVMREALGTWNFARVDIFLDIASGVLVLISAAIMGVILKNGEGIASCFTFLAATELVTGISWLIKSVINILRCRHCNSEWSGSGGHILTTG